MATSKFTERQRSELEFYKSHGRYDNDRYKDTSLVVNTEKIENDTGIWGYAYKLLGKNGFEGKKLLDLGSGTGKHGVYFAIKGANVFAIDINSDGINLAYRRSSVNNVADKINCCVGVAEDLPYTDDSFDLIFGGDILHHVNVEFSGRELARVLKPGAKCVCVETSSRNPIMMFARRYITGKFGIIKWASPEEKPLSLADVKEIGKNFSSFAYKKGEGIFSMLDRVFPKNKLWKKKLSEFDGFLFRNFPFLEKYAYHVALEFIK